MRSRANYTDGILVLHKGQVVYERYAGCLDEAGVHGAMSVTKSLDRAAGGDPRRRGSARQGGRRSASLIPELASSAFGNATVQQVMEMTTGIAYSEDYSDPNAEVWAYSAAASPLPKPADYRGPRTYHQYLATVRPEGRHGEAFAYKTVNTDVLGWIVARTTGQSLTDLLSARIWSRIGAEQDAYYTVDSIGTPFAGGGLSAGLRDLARVGQLILDGGMLDGERLFPAAAVERIRAGGDRAAFARAGYRQIPGGSYRGMWWVFHNPPRRLRGARRASARRSTSTRAPRWSSSASPPTRRPPTPRTIRPRCRPIRRWPSTCWASRQAYSGGGRCAARPQLGDQHAGEHQRAPR